MWLGNQVCPVEKAQLLLGFGSKIIGFLYPNNRFLCSKPYQAELKSERPSLFEQSTPR